MNNSLYKVTKVKKFNPDSFEIGKAYLLNAVYLGPSNLQCILLEATEDKLLFSCYDETGAEESHHRYIGITFNEIENWEITPLYLSSKVTESAAKVAISEEEEEYAKIFVPQRYHYKCAACNRYIAYDDVYCRGCGRKLIGKRNEENNL